MRKIFQQIKNNNKLLFFLKYIQEKKNISNYLKFEIFELANLHIYTYIFYLLLHRIVKE